MSANSLKVNVSGYWQACSMKSQRVMGTAILVPTRWKARRNQSQRFLPVHIFAVYILSQREHIEMESVFMHESDCKMQYSLAPEKKGKTDFGG